MYVRVGSSPVPDTLGPENDETPADPGAPGRPRGPALLGRGGLGEVNQRVSAARSLLNRPLTSYYVIAGITTLLLCLGLVMVLSTASYVDLSHNESPYHDFIVQLAGILVGVPVMWVAAHSSPRLFRALAYPLLVVAMLALALTLIPGVAKNNGVDTNRWIAVGPLTVQPSELAKLALAVWGADLLARKDKLGMLGDWRHMLVPLLPGAAVLALLVMAGDDLGTTFILLTVLLALLWVGGLPGRVFTAMLVLVGLVLVLLVVTKGYRAERLLEFWKASNTDPTGKDEQIIQGRYALGSGGVFGLGIGGSREKWGWLPESTSDMIFAVIGEELGLVGTFCVTALYGGIAWAGLRVARRVPDSFSRLLAASITAWIVMQAAVNIGGVIGLFPITGVPLPLVSQGLSSVLATMVGLGMLMSVARREPGASQALAARGRSPARRVLSRLGQAARIGP
jgi:cell division protein FtsW